MAIKLWFKTHRK